MSELYVLLDGDRVGSVEQRRGGRLVFTYDETWQESGASFPLSLSMPLTRTEHPDGIIRPFLEGLLPDNREFLERWGRRFQVSPRNPFGLLRQMGEDCAGAVQVVSQERFEEMGPPSAEEIEWLSESEVAELLRDLVQRRGTGRFAQNQGQFSLAGAQPKTALFLDNGEWGVPFGAMPTTHILKPPAQADLDGFEVNEHFCLRLANSLGLATASSRVMEFDDQSAIVVERYDRTVAPDGTVKRLHQEDTCQALGIPPWNKYEHDGGPGVPAIVELLLRESDNSQIDLGAFLDALALNWVIAGTDAHAKNYSILISSESVRLAPFYDLLSSLPYPDWVPYRKMKLAMRMDREYQVWKIRARHWEGLAERCDLDPGPLVERIAELVEAIPDATRATATGVREEGLNHDIVDRLEEAIVSHSQRCLEFLG
jgi:serine/threonine-protein kinase HipA